MNDYIHPLFALMFADVFGYVPRPDGHTPFDRLDQMRDRCTCPGSLRERREHGVGCPERETR